MDQVIEFINNFKKGFDKKAIEDCFSFGNCYWFAKILQLRFGGNIYYSPVENHFITRINYNNYDINGEYRPTEFFYEWDNYQRIEPLDSARVIRDCINKESI